MSLDQSLQLSALSAAASAPSRAISNEHSGGSHQFEHGQSTAAEFQALKAALSQPDVPEPVVGEGKKKKGSTSSATNDKELREMLACNEGRALKEVAAEVIAMEKTSKAEKSKQLFAMLWLKAVCRCAKTSVPRNRVYSNYATRCGIERVSVLNPASFGKLVRVIFPGIQTRRLGIRGESKYHYVDLALLEDSQESSELDRPVNGQRAASQPVRQPSISNRIDFNAIPRLPADTAVFPPRDHTLESQHLNVQSFASSSKGRLFSDPFSPGFHHAGSTSEFYPYELRFPPLDQPSFEENIEIELPDIRNYLPPKTDVDAAHGLTALYRTHCTSLIDSIRYCKEKQFYRLFASFHGTLTVPVQKLFAHPDIAPWIKECDWLMYQKMIRNVSQLTLQVAPVTVLRFLDNISKSLHAHITKVFHGHPFHVLEAKLEPATLFAHLLRRMLRVNSAAHAAAVMLMVDQNRDQMWNDWMMFVNPKKIMESELPNCGYEEVYKILTQEIRGLLMPLNSSPWLGDGIYYQEFVPSSNNNSASNDTVIDRIATFLAGLPTRFPQATTRTLLLCINALGSAAIREITVENGGSYQSWWITKVFVDEMSHWLASLGGFLDHKPPKLNPLMFSPEIVDGPLENGMMNGGSGSNNDSRYSSIGADFAANQSFMTIGDEIIQGTGPSDNEMNNRKFDEQFTQSTLGLDMSMDTSQQDRDLDDSGIGLMDDGQSLKYGVTGPSVDSHYVSVSTNVR